MPLWRRICALICLTLPLQAGAGPAAAPIRDEGVFDFYIRGFDVGILVFAGVRTKDYYAVNGRFATSGLAKLLRPVSYHATVQGRISRGRLDPHVYKLSIDRSGRQVSEEIRYSRGTPLPIIRKPSRPPSPDALDPASQTGTLDTLSAIYSVMRRMPAANACDTEINLFDGTRRARLTLWPTDASGRTITCTGEYRRVAGYSAKDMAHPTFPFTLRFRPARDGTIEVGEVSMRSIYGKASLKRR